jgi:hypothetical protein
MDRLVIGARIWFSINQTSRFWARLTYAPANDLTQAMILINLGTCVHSRYPPPPPTDCR